MNLPLVSVIIPNYNYANYVLIAIKSVLGQTYKNLECILVDDGSTDNSVELASKIEDKRFLILKKTNGGLSSARNEGMTVSKGEFIAFLDADDYWSAEKIENQMTIFQTTQVDIVYSKKNFVIDNEIRTNDYFVNKLDVLDFVGRNPIDGSASSLIMKRQVYLKVGLFDLNLRSHEDADYWYRCVSNKFKFGYSNNADVYIRKHKNSMSTLNNTMFFSGIILMDKILEDFFNKGYNKLYSKKEIILVVSKKMKELRWKARDSNRIDLIGLTYLYGIRNFGLSFITYKNNRKDLWYDFVNFFIKSKAIHNSNR